MASNQHGFSQTLCFFTLREFFTDCFSQFVVLIVNNWETRSKSGRVHLLRTHPPCGKPLCFDGGCI